MPFMCQNDSYLREFETAVKSCSPSSCQIINSDGKKIKLQGFNVILEDTILFPEGGGQPDDRGTINDIPVLKISRVGDEAVHFVETELTPGSTVFLKVDWNRRFDFMQQHTAQHLITAVTAKTCGYETTSVNFASSVSTIELDTDSLSASQMEDVEQAVNESIRNRVPVKPCVYHDKEDPELKKFRTRGLPADHVGSVRVLIIEDIDATLCCGTHVSNLADIQAIRLLSAEKGKKNKVTLRFLAGKRLLDYATNSFNREKAITGIVKGPAEKHCELIEKAVKGMKTAEKVCNQQLREIASLEVKLFRLQPDNVFIQHRKDGDSDYISVLLGELSDDDIPKLITVGQDKEGGMFALAGSSQLISDLGERICGLFEGKGAPSKTMFRGKAAKLTNRGKAEELLREYVKSSSEVNSEKES